MPIYLYKIVNNVNGKVYIGQSVKGKRRWYEHLANVQRGYNSALCCAIRKYGKHNFSFIILFDVHDKQSADLNEQKLIVEYNSIKLGYNRTTGGGTTLGTKMSAEAKAKISHALKGRTRTKEQIMKTTIANIGRKQTEQARINMSRAQQNRPPATAETRAKISASLRGHVISEETKRKIAANPNVKSNLGRHFSEEHKRKISIAHKNRQITPEHLANIIASNKARTGWHQTEEAKLKISKSSKGRKFTEEHKRRISESRKRKQL